MTPGRECRVCREEGKCRRMRAHLHHLHELEPGDLFRVREDAPVRELVHVSTGRCEATTSVSRQRVRFEANGEPVEFTRPARSATRPIAPTAMVERVNRA